MRIGIDARLIDETGVGRYIRNLIAELARLDTGDEYIVFLREKSFSKFESPNSKWTKQLADVAWHTLTEQLAMPKLFREARLDLLHVPYHNPSLLYAGPMVITIHDMTILHFDTGRATTLPYGLYKLKRMGYRLELAVGLQRAKHIIAVSEATKKEIVDHFGISPSKISVTYEGADENLLSKATEDAGRIIARHYLLYVGNAYPHKNLEKLLEGFIHVSDKIKLILVGRDDYFYRRLKQTVHSMNLDPSVTFFGAADDNDLASLYTHAKALVFPSLMEGFGLPAIESLILGTPVVCSDIPVFHEILGSNALYFNPNDAQDIGRVLGDLVNSRSELKVSATVRDRFKDRYSWKRMAQKTQKIYESSTRL